MGKARSKGSNNPCLKNDLHREKVLKSRGGKAKAALPSGLFLPTKGKKKVKQAEKYAGHVRRRMLAEQLAAEAEGGAQGMEVEK